MLQTRMGDLTSERWLRPLIVCAVLGAAAYLGYRASNTYLEILLGLGAGVVLLRKPEWGLVAVLFAALTIPFAIGTGTQTELNLPFLMVPGLFVLWLFRQAGARQSPLAAARVNAPIIAFAASVVISFLAGNLPWNYFAGTASLQSQLGGVSLFIFSLLLFLLAANQVRDLRWLKILCALLLVLGVPAVISRVVPEILPIVTRLLADGSQGSLFWIWLTALAGGQALFNTRLQWHWRALLLAYAVATFAVGWLFARSWVSGWLPPLVAFATLVWLRSPRLGAVLSVIGLAVINVAYPDLLQNLLALKAYSIDTRTEAWQIMIANVIPSSPILGLGPANYYFYTPLYPISGFYVSFNSHNQYVDIVAELGLVGLAIFAWLMWAIARTGWRLRVRVADGFARGYVYACLGGLAGTLWAGVHGDWFIPFVYNIGIAGFRASMLAWLFLGGLIALEQMQRAREADA